jgi:predicted dithiol-disulfide oxidoreductase (DUF899 family)
MIQDEIQKLEAEVINISRKLEKLRRDNAPVPVKNYTFQNWNGKTDLLSLFGKKSKLIVIHNMGQGCRWCTSWADGFNGLLPHLENHFAVALASKDPPEVQRQFALSRQWNFQMVSHGGGEYIVERGHGGSNDPGIVCYERKGDQIFLKNSSLFGPGDFYNPLFHVAALAGVEMDDFTPQFSYWKRPEKMDDGGTNLL